MPHRSVKVSLSQNSREDVKCNYLYLEPMVKKGIIQVDETQEMAHGREHALADMISGKVKFGSNRIVPEVGDSECKVAVSMTGH